MVKGGHGTHTSGTYYLDTSVNSLQATQRDNDVFLIYDGDQSNAKLRSSFQSVRQGNHMNVSMDTNAEFGSIKPLSGANCLVCQQLFLYLIILLGIIAHAL